MAPVQTPLRGDVDLVRNRVLSVGGAHWVRTSSGAPTTGTWNAGDICTDNAGNGYECSVGGSPGTWIVFNGGAGAWPGFGAVTAVSAGDAAANGVAATAPRSDHSHGLPAGVTPTSSAEGDAAATGVSTSVARGDHKHGRESFATPAIALGTAAAAGAATTPIRSDATILAFDASAPTTQAFGDAAAVGVATVAARRDHKHGWPALGTTAQAVGTSAGGSAATPSKSDHVHATGAGTPSTQAMADAAATGTGPAAAMTDHKHAMPSLGYGLSGNATPAIGLSTASNALSGNVSLTNTATYFDGPSMAQGTTGTWFVSGTVTLIDPSAANANFSAKLWDGTTVVASGKQQAGAANSWLVMTLSGLFTSPAGNIRISVNDGTATTGLITNNQSGNSRDSTIWGLRVA